MPFTKKHILDVESLTPGEIALILDTADNMKEISERSIKKVPTLRGKTIVLFFYEPSTRTRLSFDIAAKRLSADSISFSASTSSIVKGETLFDTAKNLEDTIKKAINEQKEGGVTVTSHREQQEDFVKTLTVSHEELIEKIGELATKIYVYDNEDMDGENMSLYNEIVREHLGEKRVSEASPKQVAPLKVILNKVQDLAEEKGIE